MAAANPQFLEGPQPLQSLVQASGVELGFDIAERLLALADEDDSLAQVFTNVVDNALKRTLAAVQALGGKIDVRRKVGSGTSFMVRLPFERK